MYIKGLDLYLCGKVRNLWYRDLRKTIQELRAIKQRLYYNVIPMMRVTMVTGLIPN